MSLQDFVLRPHPESGPLPPIGITGTLRRSGPGRLSIHYALRGSLWALRLPAPAPFPARRDGLWRATCFELFLAVEPAPGYWEFNLSPAGHWAAYRFTAYRRGMAAEAALASLPFGVERLPEALLLSLELPVDKLVPAQSTLQIGLAAVVQLTGGELTYWALAHPGPRADFHRRDGFLLTM